MGFFEAKRKKTDNVKTLTETEIQQRLYGHLRIPSTAVEDPVSEAPPAPAVTIRRPAEASMVDTLSASKIHSSLNSSTQASFNKPKVEKKKKNLFASVFLLVLSFVKNILFFVLMTAFKAIEGIFRFFVSIDFRKPNVKRIATVLGAASFVGLLFLSTYFLNVKREAAMKAPHRKKVVVEQPKPVAKPVENNVLTPADESAEQTDSTAAEEATVPAKPKTSASIPAQTSPTASSNTQAPAAGETAAAKPKPAAWKGYSIQIATFAAREDANGLVSKLKEQEVDAFVKSLERPGGRTYYCVFVGHYKDYHEADENLVSFKKKPVAKPFQDSFIRALKTE